MSDKMFRSLCFGTLALLLVVGAIALNVFLSESDTARLDRLPSGMETRAEFRPGRKDKEKPRIVHYDKQGRKTDAFVPYESGKTAYINYFIEGDAAGLISSVRRYYPAVEGVDKPQIEREMIYRPDGKSLNSDRIYLMNGTLIHKGDRLTGQVETLYETLDYRDDGKTLLNHKLFNGANSVWKLTLDQTFQPNGLLAKEFKILGDDNITSSFTDQGLLASRSSISKYGTSASTENFDTDGKTVTSKVQETYQQLVILTYEKGVLRQVRDFRHGPIMGVPLLMWVTFYDDHGVPLYRQKFTMEYTFAGQLAQSPPIKLQPWYYHLTQVQYLNAQELVTKDIDLQDDNVTPKQIVVFDNPQMPNGSRSFKVFRADGTLEKYKAYNDSRDVIKVEEHTSAENIRETVDPAVLVVSPFLPPPQLIKRAVPGGENSSAN